MQNEGERSVSDQVLEAAAVFCWRDDALVLLTQEKEHKEWELSLLIC